jgi:DNA-binding NarL/FixJ family response regulator
MSAVRVLLVDDTERDLRSIERTLRIVDAEVDIVGTVTSGTEALQLASDVAFDVAVVDYRMPGMNGVEVAAGLKQVRPDCKVVIITAYDDARGEIESSPNVDHYHEKISIDILPEVLHSLVTGEPVLVAAGAKEKRGLFRRK